jgi:hypothetical protein
MSVVNVILGRCVDGLLYPFQESALAGLATAALLTALAMLMTFRATSDQVRVEAVKRAIHACWFEIRLFNDDIRAMLRAQREMVRHYLDYLGLSIVPALWISVPLGLFVLQLQFHYAYGGLEPGRAALVKVRVKEPGAGVPVLEAPPGIRIETPTAWISSLNEAVWRITADEPGDYDLTVRLGEASVTKRVRVSSAIVRRSPLRVERQFVSQLLYPAEPPLPEGTEIRSIAVTYPPGEVRVGGRRIHWLVVFVGLSTFFALVLRGRFHVVI